MNLLHVIPISRGIGKETLTYFTALPVSVGALVSVPLRKSIVPALVVDVEDALSAKTKVRSAGHTMRKVEACIAPSIFTPAFILAARDTADFHAASTGAILSRFTTLSLAKPFIHEMETSTNITQKNTTADVGLLQTERDERFAAYRRMIRESFARNESVFLLVPETGFIEELNVSLGKGVENRIIVLHGGLSTTARVNAWQKAITSEQSLLIIGTVTFLSVPRRDIGTIIVEGERSHAYKENVRPHMDIRIFARLYAKHLGARLVFGGLPLRVETLATIDAGSAYAIGPIHTRVNTKAHVSIISMTRDTKEIRKKRPYEEVLSVELATLLTSTHMGGKHAVVFVARKGFHGVTICNDCGRIVRCPRCDAPLVLHKVTVNDTNTHICHTCGVRVPAKDRCGHCNSWKLATIGIGSQYVEEAITHLLPKATVIRLDGDTAKTPAQTAKKIALFEHTPGAILITTGIGLSFVHAPVSLVAVASMDTTLSFPDFRADERAVGTLANLRTLAGNTLLVQTRNPKHAALSFAKSGNLADVYREDIIDRKELGYPPFTVLIRVSIGGTKQTMNTHIAHVQKFFSDWKPYTYAGAGTRANVRRTHILIKVPVVSWPNTNLLKKLRSLPLSFDIDVNPDSVL